MIDLSPVIGISVGAKGAAAAVGANGMSIGAKGAAAAVGSNGTSKAVGDDAVGDSDARLGVLLSFLFLEAERGGVHALVVAPTGRLPLPFHQSCHMVVVIRGLRCMIRLLVEQRMYCR